MAPVLARRWKYAAPPWRSYEALTGELGRWLVLQPHERRPAVAEATPGERVVLEPWVDPDIARVEVLIGNDGYGTRLDVVAHPDGVISEDRHKELRSRLGQAFGDALRHWVDGW